MKYTVTYSCGHTHEVQLYGKTADRERKIKWMEEQAVCPDCYKAQKEATAKAQAEENGLPALTGSEKQIAWAEILREKALATIAEKLDTIKISQYENGDEIMKKVKPLIIKKAAELHTGSRYWIDHRDNLPTETWKTLGKETFDALGGVQAVIDNIRAELG